MRPQSSVGLGETWLQAQKNKDKATFYSLIEARAMLAPTSTSPEEREFVVDSRASMHMLTRKDSRSDKMETLGRSRNATTVQTNEEAQVYVHDLDLFVTVQMLGDTLAVLSLGKLFEEHGHTYEWASGQKPHLTKQGKTIRCRTENFVPLVVPGLSSQFWYQFVFYIATARLIKHIFKSSNRAK